MGAQAESSMYRARGLRWRWFSPIAASMLIGGCANEIHIPKPVRVASQDKAGTLLVAPTMVAPWADISPNLKPSFSLTGDQAAAQVLPVTESINQQILTAVGFSLAAGLPTSATTSSNGATNSTSSTSNVAAGATTTTSTSSNGTTSTTTTQKVPGTAPDVPTGIPAGGALPGAAGTAPVLGLDPILKYKAAASLFQEVQLLNQEVTSAANRDCYVPYVVKLKLAVVNYRPHLAYAVHSKISFAFNGQLRRDPVPASALGDAAIPWSDDPALRFLDPRCGAPDKRDMTPAVVPFLVADDMQVAVKSRAAEAATQIATALSFMVHGIGAKAGFNSVRQSLTAIANHDLSSTLTIGRSAENTIDAVISPNNVASGDPALVGQAYDVAVLVLVPRVYFGGRDNPSPAVLMVRSFTQYRDAETGEVLHARNGAALVEQASPTIEHYLSPTALRLWAKADTYEKQASIQALMDDVTVASHNRFDATLENWKRIGGQPCDYYYAKGTAPQQTCLSPAWDDTLWPAIAALLEDEPTKAVPFEASLPAPVRLSAQQVLLSDDGSHPIQAVIAGVDARSVTNLAASLNVTPYQASAAPKAGPPVSITATSLTLDQAARTLTLTFPSLKSLGITCLAAATDPAPAKVAKAKPAKGKKVGAASEAPAADACPSRPADAGITARPNNIELRLVGCDPGSQLCPELTETRLNPSVSPHLASLIAAAQKANLQGANILDYQTTNGAVAAAIKALGDYNQLVQRDTAARTSTPPADTIAAKYAADAAYKTVQETLNAAGVQQNAIAQGATAALAAAPQLIGVTLVASAKSTTPSKITLGDTGKIIVIKDGVGAFTLIAKNIPASDTAGVVVSGAAIVSAVDSAGKPLAMTKNGYTVPADGAYQFTLMNLTSGSKISVAVTDYSGDSAKGDAVKADYTAVALPASAKASPAS